MTLLSLDRLDTDEAAAILTCSKYQVAEFCRLKALDAERTARGHWIITRESVEALDHHLRNIGH